jgi:hypothetical protein
MLVPPELGAVQLTLTKSPSIEVVGALGVKGDEAAITFKRTD